MVARLSFRYAVVLNMALACFSGCGSDDEATPEPSTSTTRRDEQPVDRTPNVAEETTHPVAATDSPEATVNRPADDTPAADDAPKDHPRWLVLFRSNKPELWNTKSEGEDAYAIPIAEVKRDVQWLRLRRMDTQESAIIPMATDGLLTLHDCGDGIQWNGANHLISKNGKSHRKLGIVSRSMFYRYKSGRPLLLNPPRVAGSGYSGWGFGKVALIYSNQVSGWAGQLLPVTVFEIAVTDQELTADEATDLVIPTYGATAVAAAKEKAAAEAATRTATANTAEPVPAKTPQTQSLQLRPVPDDARVQQATTRVQELFQDDIEAADNAESTAELAQKLLVASSHFAQQPEVEFAVLQEARKHAVSTGDAELCLTIVDEWASRFEIDELEEKRLSLEAAAEHVRLAPEYRAIAESCWPVISDAITAESYGVAIKLANFGRSTARKGRSVDLSHLFENLRDEIDQRRKDLAAATAAREALETDPNDNDAHLDLGTYLCLTKGDWKTGLEHLKLAGDSDLAKVAETDLAGTDDAQEQLALGDLWMKWIERSRTSHGKRFQMAACFWYQQALPKLDGINAAVARKRIDDFGVPTHVRSAAGTNETVLTIPTASITSGRLPTPWTVIFASDDPNEWNPQNVPNTMRYLRLARQNAGDYVIIELTVEKLLTITDGFFMWNGRNLSHTGARRLGIANREWRHGYTKGHQVVPATDHKDGYGGWGFSRPCAVHGKQSYHWYDKVIPRTVFEIAVTPGPLHVSERKRLLINKR